MTIQKFTQNGKAIAIITDEEKIITDAKSALDIIMTAKYEAGTHLTAVEKKSIAEDFFILSRGLAGEALQKFIDYQAKIAIFGDFSRQAGKPLKALIYESNKGKDIFFTAAKEDAAERLAAAES